MSSMFCFQCEQTAQLSGCTAFGVCGKDPETAALQDLLIHAAKGIAQFAHRARALGAKDPAIDHFVVDALFTTTTNVNFDPARMRQEIARASSTLHVARDLYNAACASRGARPEHLNGATAWLPAHDLAGLIRQGEAVAIEKRIEQQGADVAGVQELIVYGLKGMAAYTYHARMLGKESDAVHAFLIEALDFLASNPADLNALFAMAMRAGEVNLAVLALLDDANTSAYGHPTPTPVRIDPVPGKCILVSGHDLKDLADLLEQTAETGIQVYTHGEMLPAHGYPGLKKYPHLAGHFGGGWQDQREEFDLFPGPVLMTSNCIQKPKESYAERIFTCGPVAWPGVRHIADHDYAPLVKAAHAAPGYTTEGPGKTILVGFGHNAVMGVADKVVDAVKAGAIRRFFLIGGCDGAKSGRNYFTEFAQSVPQDCVILTLACGKNRFNKLQFGDIGGIPRLLDCGQCNDAFSAIQIAVALSKAFGCGVNDLPLSFIVSWYEQKAVCILLTLLHLGIRNIRLGPSFPAFLTPPVRQLLADKFNLMPTRTADEDLKACLAAA